MGIAIIVGQWLIVFLFALLYFFIGFKRGIKKSTYYMIFSLLLTVGLIYGLYILSSGWFISDAFLLNLIERAVSIPEPIRLKLLANHDYFAIVFALADLFIKIVLFLIIYPIVKWLLTLIIALPLWKHVFNRKKIRDKKAKKAMKADLRIEKAELSGPPEGTFVSSYFDGEFSNERVKYEGDLSVKDNKKTRKQKEPKKQLTLTSRYLGGFFGFLRGAIAAILFFVPFVMFASFVEITDSSGDDALSYNIIDELYFDQTKLEEITSSFSKYGIGLLTNNVNIKGKSLNKTIADYIFTSEIKYKNREAKRVYLTDEIGGFINLGANLYYKGYFDGDFGLDDINEDNLSEIKMAFDALGSSILITDAITLYGGLGIEYFLQENDYDVNERTFGKNSLEAFVNSNFKDDVNTIYEIIEIILTNIDLTENLNDYTNIEFILSLPNEKKEAFVLAISKLGDLNSLVLTSLALDFAINLDDIQGNFDFVTKIDEELTPLTYLEDVLEYYLANPEFLKDDEFFSKISDLVEFALLGELSENDYELDFNSQLIGSILQNNNNITYLLEPFGAQFAGEVLSGVTEFDTIMNAIPLLVDYAIFKQFYNDVEDVAVKLAEELESTNWGEDIDALNDVYQTVATFGLNALLADKNYGPFIDNLIQNNHTDIEEIIDKILDESHAVNKVLNILTPVIVDMFVENEGIKEIVLTLLEDKDEDKFSYGKELKHILHAVVELNKVYSVDDLLSIKGFDNDTIPLLLEFRNLEQESFNNLKESIISLQIVDRIDNDLISYIQTQLYNKYINLDFNEITEKVNIKGDLGKLLDVVYLVSNDLALELNANNNDFNKVNFANVIANDDLYDILKFNENEQNSFLYLLAVDNIRKLSNEEPFNNFLTVPDDLMNTYKGDWVTELNSFLESTINLVGLFEGEDTPLVLSIDNLMAIDKNYLDIDLSLVKTFNENLEDTIGILLDSKIIRSTLTRAVNYRGLVLINSQINNYDISLPSEILDENDNLTKEDTLALFSDLLTIAEEYIINNSLEVVKHVLLTRNTEYYLNAFNNLSNSSIERISKNKIIESVFRNELAQVEVLDYLNNLLVSNLPSPFSNTYLLSLNESIEDNKIKKDELYHLISGIHNLQFDASLLTKFNEENLYAYLDKINENNLTLIKDSTIFMELFTNVVRNDYINDYYINLLDDQLTNVVNSNDILNGLVIDIESIFEMIRLIKDDNNANLFSRDELVTLFNVLKAFSITEIKFKGNELINLPKLKEELYLDKSAVDYLSESSIFNALLGNLLDQDGIIDYANILASKYTVYQGNQLLNFSNDNFKFDKKYFDEFGFLKSDVTNSVLTFGVSLDWKLIQENKTASKQFLTSFTKHAFKNDDKDRLYYLYNIPFIDDFINEALLHEGFVSSITIETNKLLNNVLPTNIEFTEFTNEDLDITSELFDENMARNLINVIGQMNFNSFQELALIKTINDAGNLFRIEETDTVSNAFFEVSLIKHLFNKVLSLPQSHEIVSGFLNNALASIENVTFTPEVTKIDEKWLVSTEYTNLFKALYIYNPNFAEFTNPSPKLISQLTEQVDFRGNSTKTYLDYFLDSNILYSYTDKYLSSEEFRNALAINTGNYLSGLIPGTNINLTASSLLPPMSALDEDGRLLKSEVVQIVKAFNALELESFDEFANFSDPDYIINNVNINEVLDELLESEWVYFQVGKMLTSDNTKKVMKDYTNNNLTKTMKIEHEFVLDDFDFADDRYDLVIKDGFYENYLEKAEIKKAVNVSLELYQHRNAFTGGYPTIHEAIVDLLVEDSDGISVIDKMLDSKLYLALFDKVLNVEYGTVNNLEDVYLQLINQKTKAFTQFTALDQLFKYNKVVYEENKLIKPEEIKQLFVAISLIDQINPKLETITNLINRNIIDNKDDLDRVLDSNLIHSLLSNVMLNERLVGKSVDDLNTKQSSYNLTKEILLVPEEMIIRDAINGDLVEKLELRKALIALDLLEIEVDTIASLGIDTLTNLYERNKSDGIDDLDRVLDSIYLYAVIDRVLKDDELGYLVGKEASKALDENINYFDMKPLDEHLGTSGVENDRITKKNLRDMVYSLKLIGLEGMPNEDFVGINNILGLIGQNEVDGVDDLHRFLSGDYFHYILARTLSSVTMRKKIASAADIDHELLTLNETKDSNGYMTKEETYNLFRGLNILGINDINNLDFDLTTIRNLSGSNFDLLFESSYIYQIVSLKLINELENISVFAIEDSGKYTGYVKKTEIKSLIDILNKLDTNDSDDINVDDMTVADLRELYELDSAIFKKLFSKEIIEVLGEFDEEAYRLYNGLVTEDLTDEELDAFITALEIILGEDEKFGAVDFDNLTVTQTMFDDLIAINDDFGGRHTVNRLMSKAIIESLDEDDIYDDAYLDSSIKLDLTREEIKGINSLITFLEIDEISADIVVDSLTVDQLDNIISINTLIVNKLLSKSFKEVFTDIPEAALDSNEDIIRSEMIKIVNSITHLGVVNVLEMENINADQINGTKLANVITENSLIVLRLISTEVKETGLDIPDAAYDDVLTKKDIKKTELEALANTLTALEMTVSEASNVKEDDIDGKLLNDVIDEGSLIVLRLMSNQINDSGLDVPLEAYITGSAVDIKEEEFKALANTLSALDMTVGGVSDINEDDIGSDLLNDVIDQGSLIVLRLMSNQINDSGLDVPLEAYITGSLIDIKEEEFKALANTLGALDMTVGGVSDINEDDIDSELLNNVIDQGSLIVLRLMSNQINEAGLDVPLEAYITGSAVDIKEEEFKALANTLGVLDMTVGGVSDINEAAINSAMIDKVINEESLIVLRLLSNEIISGLNEHEYGVPEGAYKTPANKDISIEEFENLSNTLTVLEEELGISNIGDALDLIDGSSMEVDVLEKVLDEDSLIIRRIITATINDSLKDEDALGDLSLVDERAYEDSSKQDFTIDELNELRAGLNILGVNTIDEALDLDEDDITFVMIIQLATNQSYVVKAIVIFIIGYNPF